MRSHGARTGAARLAHMSADYRIERLRLPSSLEGPGAEEFHEFSRLTDAVQRQIWGHEDRCSPAGYRLRVWRDSDYDETALFFVRAGGRMVGRAWCRVSLKEDLDRATVSRWLCQSKSSNRSRTTSPARRA